jgi:hypothetical protein
VTEPAAGLARIRLEWAPRATPLVARAAFASGATARLLGRRLAELDDAALGALAAVAGKGALVVLGEPSLLPWVDGVGYLGRDDAAPDLLLPTALAPSVPAAALEAAVRAAAGSTPVAVLAAPRRLIPCGRARAIDRARLVAWLGAA